MVVRYMEKSGGEQAGTGDGDDPDKGSDCILGRTLLFPGKRLLVEVVDTVEGVPIVGRVAGIGPRGALAAAEVAKSLGSRVVGVEGPPEAPEPGPDA